MPLKPLSSFSRTTGNGRIIDIEREEREGGEGKGEGERGREGGRAREVEEGREGKGEPRVLIQRGARRTVHFCCAAGFFFKTTLTL